MNQIPSRFTPKAYQHCSKTLMDNIADPHIRFDEKGVCHYYHEYYQNIPKEIGDLELSARSLDTLINKIKSNGQHRKYNCILGVSGGTDSTYLTMLAHQKNLKPLLVHFDNGWNSELAVKNIEKIIEKTGFDLYTHVFNWKEFRDIQRAHFKAHVIDLEGITDVAIYGTLMQLALKENIPYILSGYNYVTESILPKAWTFKDYVNIMDIHKKFGEGTIQLFPYFGDALSKVKYRFKSIEQIRMLDLCGYSKKQAKEEITAYFDWKDYGGKHYESIFTRFYQGYILPNKFGVDKRKAHLSTLICSGEISRDEALVELEKPIYDLAQQKTDYEFVIKKLGFTHDEFQEYLLKPGIAHDQYDTVEKKQKRNQLLYKVLSLFRN